MSFAHIAKRDPNLAFVLVQPMRAQLPPSARQNARGGRCLNNCTKGGKYALHDTLQNVFVKALNFLNCFFRGISTLLPAGQFYNFYNYLFSQTLI